MGRHSGHLRETSTPTLKGLYPHHRSMARTLVSEGLRPGELAERFGMSPSQISVILSSPLFKAEVARLEAQAEVAVSDIGRDLKSLQPRAVEVIAEDLHLAKPSPQRTRAAFDLLDRTGYGKNEGEKKEGDKHLHFHDHREIKEMSKEEMYETVMEMVEE